MEKKKLSIQVQEASFCLLHHGVVAFPTETVMGLGVVYNDYEAYNKLNAIKRRNEDKPYTMMLSCPRDIEKYAYVSEKAKKIITAFMPGSITLLLPAKPGVPGYVTHDSQVIGVRVPSNSEALLLLKEVGLPLLVPSANRSGEKPALNDQQAYEIFKNELDYIISGQATSHIPSTIVDLSHDEIVIVRPGPISLEAIMEVLSA